jgi:hypothetical protein
MSINEISRTMHSALILLDVTSSKSGVRGTVVDVRSADGHELTMSTILFAHSDRLKEMEAQIGCLRKEIVRFESIGD